MPEMEQRAAASADAPRDRAPERDYEPATPPPVLEPDFARHAAETRWSGPERVEAEEPRPRDEDMDARSRGMPDLQPRNEQLTAAEPETPAGDDESVAVGSNERQAG
jgi:hypothetical protein